MLRPWKMTRVYNRLKQMSFRTLWLSVRRRSPFVQVSRMGNPVDLLSIQLTFPFGEVILPSGKVTHPSGRMRTSLSSLGLLSPHMHSSVLLCPHYPSKFFVSSQLCFAPREWYLLLKTKDMNINQHACFPIEKGIAWQYYRKYCFVRKGVNVKQLACRKLPF